MKKLIFIIYLSFLALYSVNAQYKEREAITAYAGVGYSLLFFTNPDVSDIYPTIDLNNSTLLNEVTAFFGFKFTKSFAAEFAPSILFAKSNRNIDGFYFSQNNQRYWYIPQEASLFSLALNLKAKYYPFSGNEGSFLKDFYISAGGGIMYIKEQYTNYIYTDSTYNAQFIASREDKNDLWVPNLIFSIGYMSTNNFGYGFDIGYRIVPMPLERNTALTTSNSSNYNSLGISVKAMFNF